MLVPVSWLKDFVEIDIEPELLAERLTLAGLEVGKIKYIGVPQQTVEGVRFPTSQHLVWDDERILLGAIREVKQHPDADKLVLAMVDYGADELEQCVTGAPNLFQYIGQGEQTPPVWTALALEGAEVWDGHSDERKRMTLKGKKLRGIYNKSMVCSEKELGISEEHEGIIILDHDENYVPGTPFSQVLGDVLLDIELTPNLGHNFSMLGVAREVAALTDKDLKEPDYDFVAEGDSIEGQATIEIRQPELNPRFTMTLLKDTTVKPSPSWMQYRLKKVGQRSINNIVDVTNYITFEIGQPLHAYDYDKLVERADGKTPHLITRLPESGETLETLDDVERKLGENQILVCDESGVLGLGGVMGGAETEISAETTTVLLEAAAWNFINIRKTQQAQKVFTEAGTRFSRNIHPSRAILGSSRGIELMRQTGGGTVAQGVIDAYPLVPDGITVELPITEVHRLLGMGISVQEAADILSRLQFDVTIAGEVIHATVPDYRTDISEGVVGQADLVEEIARIIGYDNIPNTMISDMMPPQFDNRDLYIEEKIRDILVALGLQETVSYRFTSAEDEALLTPEGTDSSLPDAGYVTMANPISPDKTVLRHSLLTSLLINASHNNRHADRQQIFEIGKIYLKTNEKLPDELSRVGMLMTGVRRVIGWEQDEPVQPVNFYDLKGIIEGLVDKLHLANVSYKRSTHNTFHPGRSADVFIGKQYAGTFGELHPVVAQQIRLNGTPVLLAELDLDLLIEQARERFELTPLPLTPAILEDIALVVKDSIPASDVEAMIRQTGGKLLKDVRLFDMYQGENIAAGHRSLAYALTYQTDEKTLKDKDVQKIRKRILKRLEKELGATLRA